MGYTLRQDMIYVLYISDLGFAKNRWRKIKAAKTKQDSETNEPKF